LTSVIDIKFGKSLHNPPQMTFDSPWCWSWSFREIKVIVFPAFVVY